MQSELLKFRRRFQMLVAESDLNIYELSRQTKIERHSIYCWLNGTALPSAKNIVKISKFFSVSADYLLGLSDSKVVEE